MSELAFSLHLGSDKNKKNISRKNGKNNLSGTTSLPNNAIQNIRQLSKVDKHNYRKYDDNQELIEIVRGTSSPLDDVKELYLSEFEEARLEYNSKQSRPSRMIDNYFDNVSNNEKKDLACEIILELGDKEYWDTKNEDFKKKMSEVYKKQVDDLEMLVPNFKVASAIIHYDETSPHLHIVGVPIKVGGKNGMSKQVGKSDVFTKESLRKLQDKMRILCIESFNKEYNLTNSLKKKQKGRNRDYHITEMDNYMEMKEQPEKNQENLEKANKKSLELDNKSKEVKEIINDLKPTLIKKDNYILKQEDKDKIEKYINQVDKTNDEYKNIQTLSITLNNVDKGIQENHKQIKTLTENNEALQLRVDTLTRNNKVKDKQIKDLKEENLSLRQSLSFWKDKFLKIISFIKDKLFGKEKEREKYMDVAEDLYSKKIIEEDTFEDLKDTYEFSKNHDYEREKDDFEMEI